MTAKLLLLAGLWSLWCALHSLLVTPRMSAWFRRRLGARVAWFRLGYNLFALATVIPLVLWARHLPSGNLIRWQGVWRLLQGVLWLGAAGLFWAGARVYPLAEFLGIRQVAAHARGRQAPASHGHLVKEGVLGVVRHPWYLAALIVLWARDLDPPGLVTSAVLSIYLIIGARLEERKLLAEFGEEYRRYRREVSMVLPWKWLQKRMLRK